MKVIIPVAGAGVRLRPHTHTQPKPLIPVANKPILGHIVDTLYHAGIQDFIFVIGYLGDRIEQYIRLNYAQKITYEFVVQDPREGSAQAILCAKKQLQNEQEVLIVLGDSIVEMNYESLVSSPVTTLAVNKVADPRFFGIVEIGNNDKVYRLIEKPLIPKSNLALVGVYKIANIPALITAIERLIENKHKTNHEYQLTDALQYMLEDGEPMNATRVDKWYDCGKRESLLEANSILLRHHDFVSTAVAKYNETNIILEPVQIGENCRISHSIIGPNVAIGDHTIIKSSIIQDTIIGSFSDLKDVILTNSIVGNDSSLQGLKQSLNIGDSTEISFKE